MILKMQAWGQLIFLSVVRAGWRRPLFLGVCDFPKGLVGVDGSSQSAVVQFNVEAALRRHLAR
jgi:hypothetical protein